MSTGFKHPSKSQIVTPVSLAVDVAETPLSVTGAGTFGDVITAPLFPVVQKEFSYGGHPDLMYEYELLGGTVTYEDSMLKCNTGATLYGTAFARSNRHLRYRPGQGALFRFTAMFSSPVYGVSQTAGLYGGSENGIFVGYDYTDVSTRFGINRQSFGVREIQRLQVTAAASGAETATITLDGTPFAVPLTAGSVAENAQEIAEFAFTGWVAEAAGDTVTFLAENVGVKAGVFSISSTGTATGTYTQNAVGAAVTDDWVYQENWSHDRFDGTGPSGITLDPTAGNLFEIRFQYLGFGTVELLIENPETGKFVLAHRYEYANANTRPNVSNPTFAVGAAVSNVLAASDLTVSMGSFSAFVEGARRILGPVHGKGTEGTTAAAVPVLSIRNNSANVDGTPKVNLRELLPAYIAFAASGSNKPIRVRVIFNGTLTDPLWENYDETHSFASFDISATAISGGDVVLTTSFASGGGQAIDALPFDAGLIPGGIISIVIEPTGTAADYTASIAWKEDL